MKILMLGSPGAGKGTQAKRIAEKYHVAHVSTGDIFRKNIAENTPLGLEVKDYLDNGLLVPDELTLRIVLDRTTEADCRNGYVLDGFPRTMAQAEFLEEALKEQGSRLDMAIDVAVPDHVIVERNSGRRVCPNCGATYHIVSKKPAEENVCDACHSELIHRPDDKPETVAKRLQVYHENTEPLIGFYREQGILCEVDGNRERDTVFADIVKILDEKF